MNRSTVKGFFLLTMLFFGHSLALAVELPGLLVDKQWLVSNLDSSEVVVVDVRSTEKYKYSHILGAYNISVDKTYPSQGNRLLSISAMRKLFEKAGISNNKTVILYDEDYMDAPRMFWLLEVFGHVNKVGILDGGFPGWIRSNLPQSSEIYEAKHDKFHPTIDPDKYVTKMSILLALKTSDMMVIDARSNNDYHGTEEQSNGDTRVGHIPDAVNIPWKNNLSYLDGVPRIAPLAELSELYTRVSDNVSVFLYDDDGKKAAVNYFALRMIGKNAAIYGAGWNEWAQDVALPVVKFGSVN